MLTKRKPAVDQLRRGLDCLEVLSLIQKYPEDMKDYFVKADATLNTRYNQEFLQMQQVKKTVKKTKEHDRSLYKVMVPRNGSNWNGYGLMETVIFLYSLD